jgi:hypothetical protein
VRVSVNPFAGVGTLVSVAGTPPLTDHGRAGLCSGTPGREASGAATSDGIGPASGPHPRGSRCKAYGVVPTKANLAGRPRELDCVCVVVPVLLP